jgi:hypothetical protein
MKVLAIASALLVAFAGIATADDSVKVDSYDTLMARDAEAAPRWWGFRWSPRGHGGWKREAEASPRWSRHGMGGWKRDAEASPRRWWGFRWSPRGHGGWKREVSDTEDSEAESDLIFLPYGMTPDDLATMFKDNEAEEAAAAPATPEKDTKE